MLLVKFKCICGIIYRISARRRVNKANNSKNFVCFHCGAQKQINFNQEKTYYRQLNRYADSH